jgi:transposase
MNAYSKDLRLRVLAAVDRGMPRKEVVRTFGVSIATIGRYLRRRREGADLTPRPSTGRTPTILANLHHKRALSASSLRTTTPLPSSNTVRSGKSVRARKCLSLR